MSSDPLAPEPGRKKIVELDGLRGIAILGVLVCHFAEIFAQSDNPIASKFYWFCAQGRNGVDLFFVLSGFLITGILLDARDKQHYFRNFWGRRVLRIFPLYYAYLLLVFLVIYPLTPGLTQEYMPNPWWYATYLQNWEPGRGMNRFLVNHLWSLAIEEQFYLLWPFLVYFLPRRALGWLCLAIAVGALVLRCVLLWNGASMATVGRLTPARLDTLAIGALVAIALRNPAWKVRLEKRASFLFYLLLAVVLLFYLPTMNTANEYNTQAATSTIGLSLLALLFASMVAFALHPQSWLGTSLRNRALVKFGEISYGIYVIHAIFNEFGLRWFHQAGLSHTGFKIVELIYMPTLIACSYICAWLSYRFYEEPFLRMKRFFV